LSRGMRPVCFNQSTQLSSCILHHNKLLNQSSTTTTPYSSYKHRLWISSLSHPPRPCDVLHFIEGKVREVQSVQACGGHWFIIWACSFLPEPTCSYGSWFTRMGGWARTDKYRNVMRSLSLCPAITIAITITEPFSPVPLLLAKAQRLLHSS
jgi:hypothetical protein